MSEEKVTYEFATVVFVRILGKNRGSGYVRDDEGLVGKFFDWLKESKVDPAFMTTTGGGQWHGAFFPEDMPKVHAWLAEQGTEASKEFRGWLFNAGEDGH